MNCAQTIECLKLVCQRTQNVVKAVNIWGFQEKLSKEYLKTIEHLEILFANDQDVGLSFETNGPNIWLPLWPGPFCQLCPV